MDEKLKKQKHAKKSSFLYLETWEQSEQAGVENGAMLTTFILQNAPFRSQIFTIFFDSDGKGALTPQPKSCGRFYLDAQKKTVIWFRLMAGAY